jgi:hypothetical protein
MAVRGDDPLKIKQHAGHVAFTTTERYIRLADALDHDGFGEPFPVLPDTLVSSSECGAIDRSDRSEARNPPKTSVKQRGGRDLNPRPPA